jgi:hypothetical protein
MILFFQGIKKKVAVIGEMARSRNRKKVTQTTTDTQSQREQRLFQNEGVVGSSWSKKRQR